MGVAPTIGAPWQGKQRNRIEHRLFAVNTQNWRGKPLTSYEVIGQLNANTTHQNRLRAGTMPTPRGGLTDDAVIRTRRWMEPGSCREPEPAA